MGALCSQTYGDKITVESSMPKYCKADPVVNDKVLALVHRTWHLIVDDVRADTGDELIEYQLGGSRVVTFYDEFYKELFSMEPTTRPLFRHSIKSQGRALVKMVHAAVTLLGKGDTASLTAALKELAARHVAYGVHPYHYTPVGLCILHAFSRTLAEEEWNEEAQDAWITVYSLICQVMIPVAAEGWWTSAKVRAGQVEVGDEGREFAAVKHATSGRSTDTAAADAAMMDDVAAASASSAGDVEEPSTEAAASCASSEHPDSCC